MGDESFACFLMQALPMPGAVCAVAFGCRRLETAPVWRIAPWFGFENKTGAVYKQWPSQAY